VAPGLSKCARMLVIGEEPGLTELSASDRTRPLRSARRPKKSWVVGCAHAAVGVQPRGG
jgi:hypothetical protein